MTERKQERAVGVDLLRGLVIVLMVLDHVRDYFHVDAFVFDPTDPSRTTPLLFAIRWVTHVCAPTFVLLAGVSAWLQRANGKDAAELSRFLLSRGLWLIALEFTVLAFGFNFAWPFAFVQVIWAIGAGMIVLAALVHLPARAVLAMGVVIVIGHQLLEPVDAIGSGAGAVIWRLLLEPGPAGFMPGVILYPALPWLGILCLGYGMGFVFTQPPPRQDRVLVAAGVAALAVFLLVRGLNGYGDPRPWIVHPTAGGTIMSLLNVSKYPPSLAYVLATLGVALPLVPLLRRLRGWPAEVLLAFGRTPLATYLLHVYLVHGSALLLAAALGFPPSVLVNFLGDPGRAVTAGWGVGIGWVVAIWLLTVAALYPFSRWFAGVKRRGRSRLLSYL
jgi:uncharacterized membrane protein